MTTRLDPAAEFALRREVRDFIDRQVQDRGVVLSCDSWLSGFDPAFSRALGSRGWLGMTWPVEYGGGGRSERERWIVNEELLAAGAPVAAHWFADRQSGPAILKHGTEAQRRRFLPAICRGECFFAIGMSEPDSGSDLASVRTAAIRDGDGWILTGTKIWTSHAHRASLAIVLARTAAAVEGQRHAGLSQFLVDLAAPGITINPIRTLDGEHHFNEVVFDDVKLPDDDLLGAEGQGWSQVTAELAYERSGPERFLSTMPLLAAVVEKARGGPSSSELGSLLAEFSALRAMSAEVADALGRGDAPAAQAALVKDLGTRAESRVIDLARHLHPGETDLDAQDDLRRHVVRATLHAPGFTLRGGTNEILRGIVARSLVGERPAGSEISRTLRSICSANDVYEPSGVSSESKLRELHNRLVEDGWHRVGLAERCGGQGGDLQDAADVAAAMVGTPSALADVVLAAAPLIELAGLELPADAGLVVVAPPVEAKLLFDGPDALLSAAAERVPWASWATHLLVPVADGDDAALALVAIDDVEVTPGRNLAGEPRDAVRLSYAPVVVASVHLPLEHVLQLCEVHGALTRCIQMSAALERLVEACVSHTRTRVQFGRPLDRFQAVQQLLAELGGEAAAAGALTRRALIATAAGEPDAVDLVACAKVRTGSAAGTGARIAHQLHGAVGISQEHSLHRYTTALWSWRDEHGGETAWARRTAASVTAPDTPGVWPWLVGG
ncbi:acyl-CoA dehydrogenase family protein [Sporichthya polymorpha]|uniref:acyl-CoA dehydrogenase family protein n=1 Tax=Sporichthya polymorpha TaxID=35751 RepID=UPI000371DC95|nr:acyl-CoA dehydrogenase family protein [Sporichthya polymorpha]